MLPIMVGSLRVLFFAPHRGWTAYGLPHMPIGGAEMLWGIIRIPERPQSRNDCVCTLRQLYAGLSALRHALAVEGSDQMCVVGFLSRYSPTAKDQGNSHPQLPRGPLEIPRE